MKKNFKQAKATIGCLIVVLFVQGCSSVPPSNLQPTLSNPEGGIRSSSGMLQSSTGVVGIKSAEVITSTPSAKRFACERAAPASTHTLSGKDVAKGAANVAMLPLAVLTPQGLVGLAILAVVLPVAGVVTILKKLDCATRKTPQSADSTPQENYPLGNAAPPWQNEVNYPTSNN